MSKSATQSLHNMEIITHWTHMEEMKRSSSGFLAVLAANNLGFGLLALAEIYAKLLASDSAKRACYGYDMSKISHTEPS